MVKCCVIIPVVPNVPVGEICVPYTALIVIGIVKSKSVLKSHVTGRGYVWIIQLMARSTSLPNVPVDYTIVSTILPDVLSTVLDRSVTIVVLLVVIMEHMEHLHVFCTEECRTVQFLDTSNHDFSRNRLSTKMYGDSNRKLSCEDKCCRVATITTFIAAMLAVIAIVGRNAHIGVTAAVIAMVGHLISMFSF